MNEELYVKYVNKELAVRCIDLWTPFSKPFETHTFIPEPTPPHSDSSLIPPLPAPPLETPAITPRELSPEELKCIAILSFISLCSSVPTYVYILCTIDPAGDDLIFLVKLLGLCVVPAGIIVGIGGLLAPFERHLKKRFEADGTMVMEARDEHENVEEEDGEARGQQEMLLVPTTQRAYGASDDIV